MLERNNEEEEEGRVGAPAEHPGSPSGREFFIDNLLVQIHYIIVMI